MVLLTVSTEGELKANPLIPRQQLNEDVSKLIDWIEKYGNSSRVISADSKTYREFKVIRDRHKTS